jgi:peptidoglycan glycosyltransferase
MIIGGNLGLFPLTGVTLPFVSYGGTSLLFSFLGLLILLNISHQSSASTDSNTIRQPMHHFMSYILIFMLILEVVAVSLLSFCLRPQLVERPENPRWVVDDRFTERGNILDRDNEVIITNKGEIGSFERISNYTPLYPIVGYTNPIYGQTGIELTMYPYLRGYQGHSQSNIFSRELIYNQPPEGLDVRLTIDLDLQKSADEHLGDLSGAVIIMNANSGEILAMASHPYFDAADLSTTWEDLIKDESGPLVNRVTQGTYPPGTALFPFLLSKAYEENLELPSPVELYEKNNRELNCAIPLDGIITWDSFAKQGCLKAQEALSTLLEYDNIYESFQRIGLFSEPNLHLDVASATQPESETVMAFSSSGESFRTTPLQLGLAASSISNGGILPSPRIVSAYLSPDNVWETIPKLTSNQQVFTEEVVEEISGLLQIPEMPYWQVVETTHLEDDKSISWFVIGTTLDWPGQPAIVVVLLESPDTVRAQEIGLALIQEATNYHLENEE